MKYILLFLFTPFVAFSQCEVTSIVFGEQPICTDADTVFAVPVMITYTGTPLQIDIETTGLTYELPTQTFLHSGGNITFVIYLEDRQINDVFVTAKLRNGTCNNQTLSVSHTPPPLCTGCPEVMTLEEDLLSQSDRVYEAKDTIYTSQTIENTTVEIRAKSVILQAGFSYKTDQTNNLIIHTNTECEN